MTTTQFNFKSLFPHLSEFSLFKRTSNTLFSFPVEFKDELREAAQSITAELFSNPVLNQAQLNVAAGANILDHHQADSLPEPYFMTIDLAYAPGNGGGVNFKLIEAQAFPSISHMFFKHYEKLIELERDVFLNNDAYLSFLQTINSKSSILLEDNPWKQNTAIDFYLLTQQSPIDVLNFRDIKVRGELDKKLIYNRLIFADLNPQEFTKARELLSGLEAGSWLHHPDWFYFVSKASLPYITSKWAPDSFLVSDRPGGFSPKQNEWVLKPLFDYGCSGVNLNPSKTDIDNVEQPSEWLLQKKIILQHMPGTDLFGEIRVVLFKQNGDWVPVMFFARVNDKPFLGSQHFNLNNPQCGAAAIEFVK